MRILVTGSRDWADRVTLSGALDAAAAAGPCTIVHGGARGADRLAGEWARANGVAVQVFTADWNTYGRRAGYVRNAAMVAAGADVCLAFIKNGSPGATMTADLAERAGIPVRRYTQETR